MVSGQVPARIAQERRSTGHAPYCHRYRHLSESGYGHCPHGHGKALTCTRRHELSLAVQSSSSPAHGALPGLAGHLRQRRSLMPVLPARLAAAPLPQRPRPRRRLGQPSLDGGSEEFRGFCRNRASSSAIRSRALASSARACSSAVSASASSPRSDATSPASTSYGGGPSSPGTRGRYPPATAHRTHSQSRHPARTSLAILDP
jgi:hypothetical protein